MRSMYTCTCPYVCFLARAAYQHGCVFDYQMLRAPRQWHRALKDFAQAAGRRSVLCWGRGPLSCSDRPRGRTPPGGQREARLLRLHNEPACHASPPPSAVLPHHSQERPHPLMLLTLPICSLVHKKDGSSGIQLTMGLPSRSHVGCLFL